MKYLVVGLQKIRYLLKGMAMAVSTLASVNPLANKSLIDDTLWGRLVGRIEHDREFQQFFGEESPEKQREIAASVLDQAISFLRIVAGSDEGPYSPSEQVDIGWHAFLMYTREYADFCQQVAGRMIHHAPSDIPGVEYKSGGTVRTVAAMQVRGMYVDTSLWPKAADCSASYCTGDSCSGSTCNGE